MYVYLILVCIVSVIVPIFNDTPIHVSSKLCIDHNGWINRIKHLDEGRSVTWKACDLLSRFCCNFCQHCFFHGFMLYIFSWVFCTFAFSVFTAGWLCSSSVLSFIVAFSTWLVICVYMKLNWWQFVPFRVVSMLWYLCHMMLSTCSCNYFVISHFMLCLIKLFFLNSCSAIDIIQWEGLCEL